MLTHMESHRRSSVGSVKHWVVIHLSSDAVAEKQTYIFFVVAVCLFVFLKKKKLKGGQESFK